MATKMRKQTNNKAPQIRFKGFVGAWERQTLGNLFPITSAARVHKHEWTQFGIPFFRSSDVVSAFIGKVNTKAFISNDLYLELSERVGRVKKGDMLITGGGSIGIPYLVKTDDPLYFKDADLLWFKIRNSVDSHYLFTFFSSQSFRRYLKSISHIGTIAHYTVEQAKITPLAVPRESAEQTQIGELFEDLDSLIGLHQRKHDKLMMLKKAMLQKMFPRPGTTTPEIRFKGFSGAWEERFLSELTSKVIEKNVLKEHSETFTNSAEIGIINQRDYFDKDISNAENIGGYYIVEPDSFIYNPRISALAPVGPVNRNKLGRTGVMSPLYTVFRTKDVDNTFLEYFFKTNLWHPFMYLNGDTGARADRFSIKDAVFMELPVPYPVLLEQQKIGTYFRTMDELIFKHAIQLQKLKQIKSSCLEKMYV